MVYELTWRKNKGVEGTKHLVVTSDGVIVETTMVKGAFLGRQFEDLKEWLEGKRVEIKVVSQKITLT